LHGEVDIGPPPIGERGAEGLVGDVSVEAGAQVVHGPHEDARGAQTVPVIGFSPEVRPRLFESFFTTKGPEKGTGLGLTISREMVERFGGTRYAENRPEGGARLRLELPVHKG